MENGIISDKDRKARKAAEKAEKKNKFLNKNFVFNKVSEKKREIKNDEEVTSSTPFGLKKDVLRELPKSYCPTYTEEGWFSWWEQQGYFKPEYNESKSKETFVIMIPPPNVTGVLHIGHALTLSIEDCLVRWNRMQGKQTLWLPGTDHAGIATQTVVEKKILREKNLTRHDLGREKFVEEVWNWKNEKGDRIIEQLKKVGSSCDFSRLRFTMDKSMSNAVTEAFVRLFEMGVIYRAKRLVNWSCILRSAISDIEVDKVEIKGRTSLSVPGYERSIEFGQMVRFVYLVKDSNERLTVATTRIETMLGDTGVAIHPNDTRYTHLHGCFVVHPFRNGSVLPIILDEAVDPLFGTGVVKITPAHDATDFAIGQRHGLSMPTIFTDDGNIMPGYGKFSGMKRFDARAAVIESLTELDLFVDIADHCNVLPICSKSKDVIEPMLKDQWYLRCRESAAEALEAQQRGDLRLLPEKVHDKEWSHWLKDCHDWCISRQLWWGHRIPAYKVVSVHGDFHTGDDTWVAARTEADAIIAAATKLNVDPATVRVAQDEDVLDTWFSSQLFPFSTLGWPEKTSDFEKFYPGDLLETGHDIIFFWVARMVMIGLKMTGKLPFGSVYLHAMIRDAHGRKMSKSLGNVLDPYDVINGVSLADLHRCLELGNLDPRELDRAKASQTKDFPNGIPQCGTDALRFALLAYTVQPRDINLDVLRVNGYRNFCNKIWQAFRYSQMFGVTKTMVPGPRPVIGALAATDRWILSRLAHTVIEVNQALAAYNFAGATTALHKFWIYELCDVYIEYTKRLRSSARQATLAQVLYECLDVGLRLLHPMMPFISEELYQRLPRRASDDEDSICVARYPQACDYQDEILGWSSDEVDRTMSLALDVLRRVRVYRKDIGLLDKHDLTVSVTAIDVHGQLWSEYLADVILPLSRCVVQATDSSLSGPVIASDTAMIICHVTSDTDTKAMVAANCDQFFTVRSSDDAKQRLSQCLLSFPDTGSLTELNKVYIKQWYGWLTAQILRGKSAVKDTLDLVNKHFLVHTYLAQTKTPSAADSCLLYYVDHFQVNDKMLAHYPNLSRWLSTVKNV